MKKRNTKLENMEKIMSNILASKVYKVPGYDISYAAMEALFRPTHDWITARKLANRAKQCKDDMIPEADSESWICNLFRKDRIKNDKKHSLSEKNAKSLTITSSNSDSEVAIQSVSHKSGSRTSQTLKNIREYCKKNRDPNVRRTYSFSSEDNVDTETTIKQVRRNSCNQTIGKYFFSILT